MLAQPGTLNPYIYGLNNPVMYTDPSGKVVWIPAILGIGALAGGTASALEYYLNTPSSKRNWGQGFAAFGSGALAGAVGTGATMAAAALLSPVGEAAPFILAAFSGGIGGGFGTVTLNVLTGQCWHDGLVEGIAIGALSAWAANLFIARFLPRTPSAPKLSWTQGWGAPWNSEHVGIMSRLVAAEEAVQDITGVAWALMINFFSSSR